MAKGREKSDKPSKMEVVRKILEANPKAKPDEIVQVAQSQYGTEINKRTAGVYRYMILHPKGKTARVRAKNGAAKAAPARPVTAGVGEGLDDLFRAAEKMGWSRLKTVVERITQAPY
ncbi:MAG: hypothetical protein NZM31_00915 [Gemmatales bacterium]|nr:hypothetical protein [Gemmatales bacterium]MDW8385555.1 hypothetical protein [Gemmatales bacterium]